MPEKPSKNRKILLVDDDKFLLNMYALKFSKSGFAIDTAEGGLQAVEKLKENKDYDLVVLDLVMPGMDGIELLETVKKENLAPKTNFLVLSNQGQTTDIDRAVKLGVAGYIVKATSIPSEVVDQVENILNKMAKK